jgi:AcrR family transcriptional regulator
MLNANKEGYSTKDKIIKNAEKLFSKYSYLSVTMDDIAKELGISKPALYYHFKSKEEVFIEMTNKIFDEFTSTISSVLKKSISLEEKFKSFIVAYINFAFRKKHIAGLMMQRFSSKDKNKMKNARRHMTIIMSLIEPLVIDIIKTKKTNKNVNSKVVTTFILGGMNALVMNQLMNNFDDWNVDKISKQITSMIFAKIN